MILDMQEICWRQQPQSIKGAEPAPGKEVLAGSVGLQRRSVKGSAGRADREPPRQSCLLEESVCQPLAGGDLWKGAPTGWWTQKAELGPAVSCASHQQGVRRVHFQGPHGKSHCVW